MRVSDSYPGPQIASPAPDPQGHCQPLISIVLPTYNGSRYLREAVDSCLAQTYQNWELILVDDCSTDATPQIIAEYASRDRRIRSIRHVVNKKLPEALNTGHAAARGEYLTWTSDDNRFLPNALEEMTCFLQAHPEIALVYADSRIIDETGTFVEIYPARPASSLAYLNAVGPCFLYRKRVYEIVGRYDAELYLAEDYDYWLRVYREFEIAPITQVLYEYRRHSHSLTSTALETSLQKSVERTLRRNLAYLNRASPPDRARGWIVCAAASRHSAPLQAAVPYLKAFSIAPGFSLRYVAGKLVRRLGKRLP
jgi:glycosyltransferase involved in cell wall biosynthesis